jgi:hypothetical protein
MFNPFRSKESAHHKVMQVSLTPMTIEHKHTYGQRPPAPLPQRMTVVYQTRDGTEYKEYIPLNGQVTWTVNMPHYIEEIIRNNDSVMIRYEFGY